MAKAKYHMLINNLCYLMATGFRSGLLSSVMPGTIGSLAAIPFWLLLIHLSKQLYLLLLMLSIYVGIYICDQTSKEICVHDHGSIVWDEFVGMWITLIALPANNLQWVIIGFMMFRVLDTNKPWPIRWLDRNIQNGLGIMIDDIVAGVLSASIIFLIDCYKGTCCHNYTAI